MISEEASDASIGKGRKDKPGRGNFVQSLVNRFENSKTGTGSKHSPDTSGLSSPRESNVSPSVAGRSKATDTRNSSPESPVLLSSEATTRKVNASATSNALRDVSVEESAGDTVSPLVKKESTLMPKLRSMVSKSDLNKRESVHKSYKQLRTEKMLSLACEGSADIHVLDPRLASSWTEKVDALAAWADNCLSTGRMAPLDVPILHHANDVAVQSLEKEEMSNSESAIMSRRPQPSTPEEDLLACVQRESCHPHRAAYFAKNIKEVSLHIQCIDVTNVSD